MGSGLAWGYSSGALDQLLAQRKLEALQEADRQEKIRQFNVGAAERARAHDLNLQIHQTDRSQAAQQRKDVAARGILTGLTPPSEDIGQPAAQNLREQGLGGFIRTGPAAVTGGEEQGLETFPPTPQAPPRFTPGKEALPQGGFAYQEKEAERTAKQGLAEGAQAAKATENEATRQAATERQQTHDELMRSLANQSDETKRYIAGLVNALGQQKVDKTAPVKLTQQEQGILDTAHTIDNMGGPLLQAFRSRFPGIETNPKGFGSAWAVGSAKLGKRIYTLGGMTANDDLIQKAGAIQAFAMRALANGRINERMMDIINAHLPQPGLSAGANYDRLQRLLKEIIPDQVKALGQARNFDPANPLAGFGEFGPKPNAQPTTPNDLTYDPSTGKVN